MESKFRFLYWDDYEDYSDEEELEAEKRMRAILQNGNNGEHYEQDP
jgi:hypothetical protein